eukprot:5687004-Ditylum_brightwellii.AAC.2
MHDGSLALYGSSKDKSYKTKFVTDAPSFLKELQMIQQRDDSDDSSFHAKNTFICHCVAKELSDFENWMEEEYIEHVGMNIVKQCQHGIGHCIFYALAIKETTGHKVYSVL